MPILKVDSHGRLYESSRDRADGLGYNRHADNVDTSDVTLDSVYLSQQEKQKRDALKLNELNKYQDRVNKLKQAQWARNVQKAKIKAQSEELLRQNRQVQNNLIRRGLASPLYDKSLGCPCADQNLTQQSISHVMTGMGRDTTSRVPRTELLQQSHQAKAEQILARQHAQKAYLEKQHNAQQKAVSDKRRFLNRLDSNPSYVIKR